MKQTINFSQFCDGFTGGYYEDNFSYNGKKALFEYLEEYESGTDTEIEFDPIALACEYTEYENFAEIKEAYDLENYEELLEKTLVIGFDGGLIIQDF